ncbi:DUF4255 domain-containing protein [Microcoleus sp. ZQ-A2]
MGRFNQPITRLNRFQQRGFIFPPEPRTAMSNYLAIATVTATLQRTLQATVQVDVDGARVTTVRPDSVGSGTPETGVNLYLYNVAHNPAWGNADLRTRNSDREFLKRPLVALDLHYLISCYGNENELEPQRLMGSVVRTFHARSVLTREVIEDTVADSTYSYLADSNLADQVETVKLIPLSLSMDELSNLWSVFLQTPHSLSVAYEARVVLIESDDIPQRALPVRERRFFAAPNQPQIEQVIPQAGRLQPILADSTLIIQGQRLQSNITLLSIGGVKITPQQVSTNQIVLPLSLLPQGSLRPGVQSLQVIHARPTVTSAGRNARIAPQEMRGIESNVAAFVVRPTVRETSLSNLDETADDLRTAQVTVDIDLPIAKTQRVVLLLNERSITRPAAYLFDALPRTEDTNSITFSLYDVKPGEYLVRVQVDGAESLLNVDTNSNSPTFEQYIGPTVVIP